MRVAEAQSRGALAVVDARHDDGDERARVGQPRCAVTEGAEEALVDLGSGVSEGSPVRGVEGLFQVEVGAVVQCRLNPEGLLVLEVGLRPRGLVADRDAGIDAVGDDVGGEAPGRGGPDLAPEDDADLVGTTEREVVSDGGLEPGRATWGRSKTRVSEISIWRPRRPSRSPAARSASVSGLGSSGSQRAMRRWTCPAPSERARRLASSGSSTRAQSVVKVLVADAACFELALQPLVTVGRDAEGIGGIRGTAARRRGPTRDRRGRSTMSRAPWTGG